MRFVFLISAVFGLNAAAFLIDTQFPHLLVHVDKRQPDTALGTQQSGDVEHAVNTMVLFDVPTNLAARCQLNFHYNVDPKANVPKALWGVPPYKFNVSSIESRIINKDKDTWNDHPQPGQWVATIEVNQAGQVFVQGGDVVCTKGSPSQFILYPENPDRDFGLTWFELSDPLNGITFEMHF